MTTAIVGSDLHVPYHNKASWEIFLEVVSVVKPDITILNGDTLDCLQISKFDQDPARINTLQDDINVAYKLLTQLRKVTKKRIVLTEGNHEKRLHRMVCNLSGGARELARLNAFQEAIVWPSLLKLSSLNIGWIPEHKQPVINLIPNFAVKHGTIVRKYSGYSAKAEFESIGMSGISGHTHRAGIFHHRTLRGQYIWVENGCLCDLEPEYCQIANWQNAFTVITTNDKTTPPQVEQVVINDGRTTYRDTLIKK